MADPVIVDGDMASFLPSFGVATVVVRPGPITGSGPPTFGGKAICIEGDEASVEVAGCVYMTPQYSIPGSGTLKIDALAGDQVAQKSTIDGTPMILKGGSFTAKFEVQSPAQQPPPGPGSPIPDSTTAYSGSGSFVTTNTKLTAT
jgi:hypothetical protein